MVAAFGSFANPNREDLHMRLSHEVLSESKSARELTISERTNENAIDLLNKAKALVMAVWQGSGRATTEQVAEYYNAPIKTIQNLLNTNREEFADEVENVTGEELRQARLVFSLPSSTSNINLWSPRGMLRVGLMLTKSAVAKNVRDVVLNVVESTQPQRPHLSLPEAQEKIDWMEAQLEKATRRGNMRSVQQWEIVISQYVDAFIMLQPSLPAQNKLRYEGVVDVCIRLNLQLPSTHEPALGRHAGKVIGHLRISSDDEQLKDYRTSAASGKRVPAFMYPANHPEVEQCVKNYCQSLENKKNSKAKKMKDIEAIVDEFLE